MLALKKSIRAISPPLFSIDTHPGEKLTTNDKVDTIYFGYQLDCKSVVTPENYRDL